MNIIASKTYEEDFKGHPTMVIEGNFINQKNEGFTVKFKFGVTKAKLLMEHIPDVEAFLKRHSEASSASKSGVGTSSASADAGKGGE